MTTTTGIDLMDDDEYDANHLLSGKVNIYSDLQAAVDEVVERGVKVKLENGRMPKSWYPTEAKKLNKLSLEQGVLLDLSVEQLRNRVRRLVKKRKNADRKAAIDEVVERGLKVKLENDRMPRSWFPTEVGQLKQSKIGTTAEALRHRVRALVREKKEGSTITTPPTSPPPPPAFQHPPSLALVPPRTMNSLVVPPLPPSTRLRNNNLTLKPLSSCLENVLETPMLKHIENQGSRPISGRDWGESTSCCDRTIDVCWHIFEESWIASEFCTNEALRIDYHIKLDEEEKSSLFGINDSDLNFDHEDDNEDIACINCHKSIAYARCNNVKSSAFIVNRQQNRRQNTKMQKYIRKSLSIATLPDFQPPNSHPYRLSETPKKNLSLSNATPFGIITESNLFLVVLSFLEGGDLIHSVSLVSTRFADFAAEALGNLMLVSVGCEPYSWGAKFLSDHSDLMDNHDLSLVGEPSLAKSMEKGWQCLIRQFPWAMYLSDGAFKRVYKVWNDYCGAYEAISVMDVNAVTNLGNLNVVGTELAVSVILSSLTKRNICPNFVVTRGMFTCQHEPPASLWGCRDYCAPGGAFYDRNTQSRKNHMPPSGVRGKYQYIRMELCDAGDVETFIRKHPDKMLTPWDCRNLLFQMAFALHVVADRFSLKHYDVKLLNFFLQSVTDPTIAIKDHPNVVLRYGVGLNIFRLRMHPSVAVIAKLADYGTAVMRSDTDGQSISLGQFTTLENTPPDLLILGNAAKQGYEHDSFGLGLCMLHLFTGYCPYEEILDDVFCPENLKRELRKIWKQRSSYSIIRSVIMENEKEDETLYDTLYRFLVLFGIPGNQFGGKRNGKVWHAINSTLSAPMGQRRNNSDSKIYFSDRKKYSLAEGVDMRIAGARRRLSELDGAMDLLHSLVSFDPQKRATPLEVINSRFMAELIEDKNTIYGKNDMVKSYTAYLTT